MLRRSTLLEERKREKPQGGKGAPDSGRRKNSAHDVHAANGGMSRTTGRSLLTYVGNMRRITTRMLAPVTQTLSGRERAE